MMNIIVWLPILAAVIGASVGATITGVFNHHQHNKQIEEERSRENETRRLERIRLAEARRYENLDRFEPVINLAVDILLRRNLSVQLSVERLSTLEYEWLKVQKKADLIFMDREIQPLFGRIGHYLWLLRDFYDSKISLEEIEKERNILINEFNQIFSVFINIGSLVASNS